MQPFEITVTNTHDGHSPTTTNATARTFEGAMEEAAREAAEYSHSLITIWELTKIEPHRCTSCHQTTHRPFRYVARAVFVDGILSQPLEKAVAA